MPASRRRLTRSGQGRGLGEPRFLFFGFLAGETELQRAFAGDPTPQVSAVKFQMGLIEGLAQHGAALRIVGALPIASYPRSRTLAVGTKPFAPRSPGVSGVLMWSVNLPILKLVLRLFTTLWFGARLLRSGEGRDGIIVYSLHTPFVAAAIWLKRLFKVPVFVFVPDLPMHMAGRELTGVHALAKRSDDRLLRTLIARADLVFPITIGIAQAWLPPSVKHLVVEGIAPTAKPAPRKAQPSPTPRMLYTGQFSHVLGLAAMFSARRDIDATLVFVGGGPDLEGLKELAKSDPRIVVKPFATGQAFEREFEAADFLLNPRDPEWEGAKFSFPSKLFDYMARGRPILSTRMPGIPEEYFECFMELRHENADLLAASFKRAIEASAQEIARRIDVGETMLATAKSSRAVAGRILEAIARC